MSRQPVCRFNRTLRVGLLRAAAEELPGADERAWGNCHLSLFADAKHRHVPVGLGDQVGDPEPGRCQVVEPVDAEDDPAVPAWCAVIDPTEEVFVELEALGFAETVIVGLA